MSGDDEFGEKTDLTRIEDLSEFLHQNDPDIDAQLDSSDDKSDSPPEFEELPSLDDLEEDEEAEETSFDAQESTDSFELDSNDDEESEDFSEFNTQDQEEEKEDDDSIETDSFSMEENSFDNDSEDEEEEDDSFSMNSEEDNFSNNDSFELSEDDDNNELDQESEEESSFDANDDAFDSSDSDFETEEETDDSLNFDSSDELESETEENSFDDLQEDNTFESEQVEPEVTETIAEEVIKPAPIAAPIHVDRSEKFEDIKAFAKNITYGKIAVGGNPAYSIILRNIKYEEDAEDITILLSEHGLVDQVGEDSIKQSLESGSLLISQISEYAAIYLTHKFRRFDLDIQMGLSDELHPSKSYDRDSVGLISKSRVNQNKSETTRLENSEIDIDSIILSTTPTLEHYKIIEYLGIVTEFVIITQDQLIADSQLSEFHNREAKGHLDSLDDEEKVEPEIDLNHNNIYKDLSEKLKPQCMKQNANAVVGINYQITPISGGEKYKVSCSGSAVWIIDIN